MNNLPLISFIIAAYNEEKYIRECVESCLNQTYSAVEVCITDDGSIDDTWKILRENFFPNKKICMEKFDENRGKVCAFNNSYKMSRGAYVAIIGADDINIPDRIDAELKFKDKYDLICSDLDQISRDGSQIINHMLAEKLFKMKSPAEFSFEELILQPKVFGGTILMSRRLADKIFPLPEKLAHEDWWIPLMASHYSKVFFINKSLIKYRQHGKNSSGFGAVKSLTFRKWQKQITRDLSYYELLNDFLIKKDIISYKLFVENKINYFKMIRSEKFRQRLVYFLKLNKIKIREMLKAVLYLISPYILYFKFKMRYFIGKK
jgi:glycosyltransferase involved in cell wall biosynthesis